MAKKLFLVQLLAIFTLTVCFIFGPKCLVNISYICFASHLKEKAFFASCFYSLAASLCICQHNLKLLNNSH